MYENCNTHRLNKQYFTWNMNVDVAATIDESDMEEAEELLQEVMADE